MAVPLVIDIVDTLTDTVVFTHAGYPNESGSLCLTGAIDLPAGTYDFALRLHSYGGTVTWQGGAFQMIVGQTVEERHCFGESIDEG